MNFPKSLATVLVVSLLAGGAAHAQDNRFRPAAPGGGVAVPVQQVTVYELRAPDCELCQKIADKHLGSVPGVLSAEFGSNGQRLTVRWQAGVAPSHEAVMLLLQRAGFHVAAVR